MASGDEDIRTGEHGVIGGFGRGLAMVLVLAAAVRIAYIVGVHHNFPLTGDAWVYHHEARFVANGRGFVNPVAWGYEKVVSQAADHPPLYIVVLALGYVLGVRSNLSQMLLNGIFGVVTVALVALLARRLVGDRGGLIAGVIAALYPGLWAWNGQVLSESLSVLLLTATVSVAYRYLEDRSIRRAALLGALIGMCALTRSELGLLVLLIPGLAVAHFRAGRGLGQLAKHAAVATAMLVVVLLPWTAFNLSRFDRPVLLGTGLGRALASGSCPETISGGATGFWSISCLAEPMGVTKEQQRGLDESEMDELWRREAVKRMGANSGRMPVLMFARIGRMFGFWAPVQQLYYDQLSETREWWVAGSSMATFYLLAAGAVAGGVVLRRRRVRLWILVLPIAIAAFGAMTAFGTTRYRAPAEPCLVVLAGIGVDAAVRRYERRRAGTGATTAGSGATVSGHAEDRALAGVGGYPANTTAHAGDDRRFAPGEPMGAPAGHGAPGGYDDGWDDQRQRALWTGRAPPPPPPDDEPYWDEQAGAWTDGYGNYTDGHRTWNDGRSQWVDAPGGYDQAGYGDPRARAQWDEHPTTGFAGGDGPPDRDRSGPLPAPEPSVPQRPVRLPLVVATVIAVMLGVGAAGVWVTQVTGNARPTTPNQMPAMPSLPPR